MCLMDKLNSKLSSVFCMHIKHVLLQGGVCASQSGSIGKGCLEMGWSSSLPSLPLKLQAEGQMWWPLLEQGCWVSPNSYSHLSLVLFHSWLRKIILKLIIIGLSEQITIRCIL